VSVGADGDALVLRVRNVWVNGIELDATRMPGPSQQLGFPVGFNSGVERGSVSLYPTPGQTGEIVCRVTYGPKMSATTLPDFLMDRYAEAIAAGAKARLMLMPGVQWSNPSLAGYYDGVFSSGITSARDEMSTDGAVGSIFVRPRRFA
jgi:hypothetical protein